MKKKIDIVRADFVVFKGKIVIQAQKDVATKAT